MKKILVAPELKGLIENEKHISKRANYRIFTAASGEEALRIHRIKKADLIIVDLQMDGMGGDELASVIKKDRRLSQTFLMLLCPDRKADIKRCQNSKADFFFTKPVNARLLLSKVRQVLNIKERGSVRIPLRITLIASAWRTFSCYAYNVSTTGILIETDEVLHRDDSVACLFCISHSDEIIVRGKVVRVKIRANDTYQYGIDFSDLSSNSYAAIEAFVNKQLEIYISSR
jgi:DNA-binding response OmpR family regulator